MQIIAKEQVTHECVNLNILTKILLKVFLTFSCGWDLGKEHFVQFTREIKHASCGSFTLFIEFQSLLFRDFVLMNEFLETVES